MHKFLSIYLILFTTTVSMAKLESPVWNICDYGAVGDGNTLNTQAIQKAIDACAAKGGGTVYFPAGTYKSGTIYPKSNVTLYLDTGSTLLGSKDMKDYQPGVFDYGSSNVFIHALRVDHVSIVGGGIIDGNMALKNGTYGPPAVAFEYCNDVLIRDVSIVNSAGTTPAIHYCKHVDLIRVKLINCYGAGLTTYCCQDVLVDGMYIDTVMDDAICIKNEVTSGPNYTTPKDGFVTSDFIVTNTTIRNSMNPAIKFGTQTAGVFRNIVFSNCTFDNVGALFTIDLMRPNKKEVPERKIENVILSGITAKNIRQLLDVRSNDVKEPIIRNITLENILVDGINEPSLLAGKSGAPVQNMTLRNLHLRYHGKPAPYFLKARYVEDLQIRNVQIDMGGSVETFLDIEQSDKVNVDYLSCEGLAGRGPIIRSNQVRKLSVRNCQIPEVETLVYAAGEQTREIYCSGDELHKAVKPLDASSEVQGLSAFPEAGRVTYENLTVSDTIKANQSFKVNFTLTNEGSSGFVNQKLYVNDVLDSTKYLWLPEGASQKLSLNTQRYYQPGTYHLKVGPLTAEAMVTATPAALEFGEQMEIVAPRKAGALTSVTTSIKNVGGTDANKKVKLMADGSVANTTPVALAPGEEKTVTIQHRFNGKSRGELGIGDFPAWPYYTFTNNRAHFFQTRDKIIMDAAGDKWDSGSGDYSTVYLDDVEGDFVVTVRLLSQKTHSAHAAGGLMIRNDLSDPQSTGLVGIHIKPKYGGSQLWWGDCNGDGKPDSGYYGWGGYPLWLKIEKRGTTFTGYTSVDGELWHIPQAGEQDRERAHEGVFQIPSAKQIQDVGIFAGSDGNELSHMEFDNFRLARPISCEKLKFSDLQLSTTELAMEESFTISAVVTNTSDTEGAAKIGFYMDDHEPLTKWMDLKSGQSRPVEFTFDLTHKLIKGCFWMVEPVPDYIFGEHQVTIGTHAPKTIDIRKADTIK